MMQHKTVNTRPGPQVGFTLIEIMIVVVIISILAMIAYPSYTESVRKSRRADCQGALVGMGAAMERHFTANNSYEGAGTDAVGAVANVTGVPTIFPSECPLDGNTKYYDLTINAVPTPSTYTLHAAPKGAQANDKCGTLTLTNTGVRGLTGQDAGVTSADCWQ